MVEHLDAVLAARTVTSSFRPENLASLAKLILVCVLRDQQMFEGVSPRLKEGSARDDAWVRARGEEEKDLGGGHAEVEDDGEGRGDGPVGADYKDREGYQDEQDAEIEVEDSSELLLWA